MVGDTDGNPVGEKLGAAVGAQVTAQHSAAQFSMKLYPEKQHPAWGSPRTEPHRNSGPVFTPEHMADGDDEGELVVGAAVGPLEVG